MKFNFVKSKAVFFAISLVMVVACIVSFCTLGFNWDIEFVGGTELTYDLGKTVEKADEDAIEELVISIIGKDSYSSLRVVGDAKDQVVVRTKLVDSEVDYDSLGADIDAKVVEAYPNATVVSKAENEIVYNIPATETEAAEGEEAKTVEADTNTIYSAIADLVYDADVEENEEGNFVVSYEPNSEISTLRSEITSSVIELYPDAVLNSTDTVSAEVSGSLKQSAILATGVAILLMLVYIAFRFEISSAFAAIVCLTHDVLVMLLAYSVFQIPMGSTVIAAILTILGYSINATIVIFDRVRENIKKMPGASFEEKVDKGIKSTLWRSLNTTITTLLTIGLIYFLGVTSIKNFALPLIVGILAGAYSSICLAGNVWYVLKGKKSK